MTDDKINILMDDVPPTAELSKSSTKSLRKVACQSHGVEAVQAEGHGHGHSSKPPSILTATASAIINFLLMFGLCSAYGIIMFEDEWNARHRGLGVKMNLCTALVVGTLLAAFSKVGVAIGGPDLNPVVFLGMFVQNIAESIASQRGLSIPSGGGRRLLESCGALLELDPAEAFRRLAPAASDEEFCTGAHYASHALDCEKYHDELRATTIFAVAVSSLVLGLLFFLLGRFKMTRFVTYVPTNIMEAFLSCVGYKVFKYALKFCKYKPKQFIPAACVGVPLYFIKALHLGNPAVVIPLVLLIPLGVFYTIVYGSGGSLASARSAGWMFDELENVEFYSVWTDSLGKAGDINFKAWITTLVDFAIMIIVVLLDCMLKLSSTESKLPVKADKDYEVQLYGIGNFITTLCGSSVGYMQLKFNVINYGVMGNVKDRRGGLIYALLCGALFFWTTDLFNYLPRFFLSTLLFFAGSGFVAENLWGSRKYLTVAEWLQIFVILAVFVFAGSLLYAVIVGGMITGITFIMRYSKIPCVVGRPMRGGDGQLLESCGTLTQKKVQHVANSWVLIIRLKGYIFFASAQKLIGWVLQHLEKQEAQGLPEYQRIHYLIFDCPQLDGLDSSASKAFGKLANAAREMHVRILWSGIATDTVVQLKNCGTISSDNQLFANLAEAKHAVEVDIRRYLAKRQEQWLQLHPMFGLAHGVLRDRMAVEPFEDILRLDIERLGCPWQYCSRLKMKAFSTVVWRANQQSPTLFLVHSGKVGMFTSIPSTFAGGTWQPPVAICGRGALLNREAVLERPTRLHAVALEDGELLCWSEVQWARMLREQPAMAGAILKSVLRQEDTSQEVRAETTQPSKAMSFVPESEEAAAEASVEQSDLSPERSGPKGAVWEDLGPYLQGVSAARALADMGLFTASESGVMPRLTPTMTETLERNLVTAFWTYAAAPQNGDMHPAGPPVVPADRLGEALVYAGVFGLAITDGQLGELEEAEFVGLGKELAVAGLSGLQTKKVAGLFEQSRDANERLDRAAVAKLLREKVHPDFSVHRANDLVDLCAGPGAESIDEGAFVAMVSRLVRAHEPDWCVLLGLRQLLGGTEADSLDDRLTPELLAKNAACPQLSLEEAQELLWSADLLEGPENAGLDVRMAALALWPVDVPAIGLPPPPSDAKKDAVPGRIYSERSSKPLLLGLHSLASNNSARRLACQRAAAGPEQANVAVPDDDSEEAAVEKEQYPNTCRARLHLFLDYPESSPAASRWSVVMGIFIMISVLTLVMKPLITPSDEPVDETEEAVWENFERFFTALFTLEFLVRFSVADALGNQTFVGFLKSPMNICDIVAVLPWYVDLIIGSSAEEFRLFRIARLMRLARLVRLGKLARRSAAFAPIAMIMVVIWGIFMKTNL